MMDETARKILLALGLVGGAGLLVWLGVRHSSPSSSSNPGPQVVAEVPVPSILPDSVIVEEKVREWVAKGYPEGLARKAAKWAQGWSIGLTARLGMPTEYAAKIYPKSLTLAERWLEGVWGLFA